MCLTYYFSGSVTIIWRVATNLENLEKSGNCQENCQIREILGNSKACTSSVIRQKGESQNGCFNKIKHIKFSEKRTFLTPWYALLPYYRRLVKHVIAYLFLVNLFFSFRALVFQENLNFGKLIFNCSLCFSLSMKYF